MKKVIGATTLFVLFMVFILPFMAPTVIDLVPYNDQPPYSTDIKRTIQGGRMVTQKFSAQENNLSAIGVSIGNPNLHNKYEVIFNLYDTQGTLIRSAFLNGANIEDGDFVKFVFDAIPDSKGKEYLFTISSPQAGEEEVLYVFLTHETPSWITEAQYGDELFNGGLPFVTFHTPMSKLQTAKSVLRTWLKKII